MSFCKLGKFVCKKDFNPKGVRNKEKKLVHRFQSLIINTLLEEFIYLSMYLETISISRYLFLFIYTALSMYKI